MKLIKQTELINPTLDKVYQVFLYQVTQATYVVHFRYGNKGQTLKESVKTINPVSLIKAEKVFNQLIQSKLIQGYHEQVTKINDLENLHQQVQKIILATACTERSRSVTENKNNLPLLKYAVSLLNTSKNFADLTPEVKTVMEEMITTLSAQDEIEFLTNKNENNAAKIQELEREIEQQKQLVEMGKIEKAIACSETLKATEQELAALNTILAATKLFDNLINPPTPLKFKLSLALNQLIYPNKTKENYLREYQQINAHQGEITYLTFAPDGKIFASASEDKTIKLWNLKGENLKTFNYSSGLSKYGQQHLAFSPDNQLIGAASNGAMKIWNMEGKELINIPGNFYSVGFSLDGNIIAAGGVIRGRSGNNGYYSLVKFWTREGEELKTLKEELQPNPRGGYTLTYGSFQFSPDGKTVAVKLKNNFSFWQINDEEFTLIKELEIEQTAFSFSPDISPDNSLVTLITAQTCDNGESKIQIWDNDGSLLTSFQIQIEVVNYLSFSDDGKIIAFVNKKPSQTPVQFWTKEGELIKTLTFDYPAYIHQLFFSEDGETVTFFDVNYGKGKLNFWNWKKTANFQTNLETREVGGFTLGISPNQQIFAIGDRKGKIRLWRQETAAKPLTLKTPVNTRFVDFTPDGKELFAGIDSSISPLKHWQIDGTEISSLSAENIKIKAISFSADGKFIVTTEKQRITSTEELKNRKQQTFPVKIWQRNNELIKTFKTLGEQGEYVCFHPDSKTIAVSINDASQAEKLQLIDLDGKIIKTMLGTKRMCLHLSFSPDGKYLAAACDQSIKILSLEGEQICSLSYKIGIIVNRNFVSFSPDSQTFAHISNNNKYLVEIRRLDGSLVQTLQGHEYHVHSVSFHPSGEIIATASGDNTLKFWNLLGEEIETISLEKGANCLSFSPDGKWLASSHLSGQVILWNLDYNELKKQGLQLIL